MALSDGEQISKIWENPLRELFQRGIEEGFFNPLLRDDGKPRFIDITCQGDDHTDNKGTAGKCQQYAKELVEPSEHYQREEFFYDF